MAHASSVHIDKMRDKLLSLTDVRGRLSASEPLEPHAFPVSGDFQMVIPEGWQAHAETQVVEGAWVRTASALNGGTEYPLTKAAILELGALGGIPREHQQVMKYTLLQDEANWWLQEGLGDKQFKLLKDESGTVLGVTRATINPFSNIALLDKALEGIEARYGKGEVLVDYKFHHDLENTQMRLIVPGQQRTITDTRQADDTWSVGLNYRNSLIGLKPPQVDGYLFRWWCTNGCYDTMSTRTAPRRQIKDEADALEWMGVAVDEVLGGLESTLDGVQALTQIPVEGDVSVVLGDLFEQHSVPRAERTRVLNSMADLGGDLTMYDVQNAMTAAANMDDLSPRSVDILMGAGGHIAHAAAGRCDGSLENGCRRILPEGFAVPVQEQAEESAE